MINTIGNWQKKLAVSRILAPFFVVCGVWSISIPCLADTNYYSFPAGQACPDFDLAIKVVTPDNSHYKDFYDKNGNHTRRLQVAAGAQLTFTDVATNFAFTIKTGGSVQHVTYNSDGSSTWVSTGYQTLIMYPTDNPHGPSTTLYIGRLVYTNDASWNTTFQSFTGKSADICAALKNRMPI